MTRAHLPSRRLNQTCKVRYLFSSGQKEMDILITVGYDERHRAKEVFCADFKAGSDLHAIVMDACIPLSRLLQHGDTPDELARSMCEPHSLLGTIAAAVAREGQFTSS